MRNFYKEKKQSTVSDNPISRNHGLQIILVYICTKSYI
jgi:hypothetical protein